jgi:hypothetical protein
VFVNGKPLKQQCEYTFPTDREWYPECWTRLQGRRALLVLRLSRHRELFSRSTQAIQRARTPPFDDFV